MEIFVGRCRLDAQGVDETAGKQVLEQVLNHALAFDTFHPGKSLADDGYSIMPPAFIACVSFVQMAVVLKLEYLRV